MSWLCDLICGKPEPEAPNILNDMKGLAKKFNGNDFQILTPDEFISLAQAEFGSYVTKIEETSDHYYYVYPSSVKTQFNSIYKKYKPVYVPEIFDCDNFALDYIAFLHRFANEIPNAKYSFAIGMCSGKFHWVSGYHRANVIITDDKKVCLFDAKPLKTYHEDSWEGNEFRIIYY